MSHRLRVAPIVEGHGEVGSVRILIERIWMELLGGEYVDIIKPIRQKRYKLAKKEELGKAVSLALLKCSSAARIDDPTMVLILIDAEEDLPCELGPDLLGYTKLSHQHADVSCVIANVEYETWFVAAAESLEKYLSLKSMKTIPSAPEEQRLGKAWIERYYTGTKYSPTQDQPAMTATMDLSLCRSRSQSFDKLCREFEKRLQR